MFRSNVQLLEKRANDDSPLHANDYMLIFELCLGLEEFISSPSYACPFTLNELCRGETSFARCRI